MSSADDIRTGTDGVSSPPNGPWLSSLTDEERYAPHPALVAAKAEVERLRSALTALVEDVETFGEPRRHAKALKVASEALGSSETEA